MARISIYVPDELKARMAAIGEAANWSDLVRPAIASAVALHEHRKVNTMDTAIQRLKASKERLIRAVTIDAEEQGRNWAQNHAEYDQLERIHEEVQSSLEWEANVKLTDLKHLIDPFDEMPYVTFEEQIGLKGHIVERDKYSSSFAKGVDKFFREVKDKL